MEFIYYEICLEELLFSLKSILTPKESTISSIKEIHIHFEPSIVFNINFFKLK
jgi:hypothetical protein